MKDQMMYFLDSDLVPEGICDDHIRLEYTEEFRGAGELLCVLSLSAPHIPEPGDFVLCGGRLIYAVDSVVRDSASGTATVRGRGLLSLFDRRVATVTAAAYGRCDLLVRSMVSRYCAGLMPKTVNVVQGEDFPIYRGVLSAGSVLDRFVTMTRLHGLGLKLDYDRTDESLDLTMPSVRDRRVGNTAGNEAVLLSENFGSTSAVKAETDLTDYVNRAVVRGAEKTDGTYYTVMVDASDLAFADSFDDSDEDVREGLVISGIGVGIYTELDGDGDAVFDEDGYLEALENRGAEYLAAHRPKFTAAAQLSPSCAADVEVGDLCTLNSPASSASSGLIIRKKCAVADGAAVWTVDLDTL